MHAESKFRGRRLALTTGAAILCLAGLKLAIHLYAGRHYGYSVDELYYLACSRHLDWGADRPAVGSADARAVLVGLFATVGTGMSAMMADTGAPARWRPGVGSNSLVGSPGSQM